ncbi:hypothetical protein HanPI659440_Chr13g0519581 [Helianthus annuus]|nr:hypothetical protein HanPI659440_Chr13g0519581 [Helianthus annuus]
MTKLLMCNRVDTKITVPSMEDHDECFFLLGIEDVNYSFGTWVNNEYERCSGALTKTVVML